MPEVDDATFLRNILQDKQTLKAGPPDLGVKTSGSKWSDEIFAKEWGEIATGYWAKGRDTVKGVSGATYCLAAYLGLHSIKSEEFETAWKLMNAAVMVNEETIYPEGAEDLAAPVTAAHPAITSYVFGKAGGATYKASDQVSFSVENVNTWYSGMVAMRERDGSRQAYINIVSYIIDTSFRLCQKDPESVAKHICTRSRDTYNSVTTSTLIEYFPPPHQNFILAFSTQFAAQQKRAKDRVAALAKTIKDSKSGIVTGWLTATCMLSLSGTGLGLIMWYRKVCQHYEMTEDEAAEYFFVDPMLKGMRRLFDWGNSMGPKEVTWMWSRILDNTALIEYSVQKNVKFCLVCALLVFDLNVESVTEIQQFSGKTSGIGNLMSIAKALNDILGKTNEESQAFGKGLKVKERALVYVREESKAGRKTKGDKEGDEDDDDDESLS
ncbi:nucleoprotein [Nephotettix cincticeps negative-stranded RNA virus 1]|nr:nucleoprotein [Nephotettix cincticeps negative-stranded RNA virus 1]UHK03287.1 MAG: hypothetical protein FNCRV1_gp1 [Hangzhou nephotettix cincticeps rhabdovirus 1]